jgi:hypothetical protein
MSLINFNNNIGSLIAPFPGLPYHVNASATSNVINATGESCAFIGYINLFNGTGSSATISNAGGKIHWRAGSVTFSNAATRVRVGIQDVTAATGIEDGTYDVYSELTGGGGGITANVINSTAMTSGTKTINHGDLVAIIIEMTVLGGADSISVINSAVTTLVPYKTVDSGAGPVKSTSNSLPCVTIEFDDGTTGWFDSSWVWLNTTRTYASTNNPDEYALIFSTPAKMEITDVVVFMGSVSSTDDFEIILYSDPLVSPNAERTISVSAVKTSANNTNSYYWGKFSSAYVISANTKYAISVRPTTANPISISNFVYGAGNEKLLDPTVLGQNWYLGTRTNITGAFSETKSTIPSIGFWARKIDDGASINNGSVWIG